MHRTNRLGPAQASADRGDEIVVAHEQFIVMHVVHVVGVHDATLVSASEREALVRRAYVSAAGVKSTELSLGQSRARMTTVLGADLDVTRALLFRTKETGTGSLASTGLGAGAPWRPVGNHAVLGAGLLVALGVRDELATGFASVVLRMDDGAAAPHLASAAGLVAAGEGTPVAEFAVHRAWHGVAFFGAFKGCAFLASKSGPGGDLASTETFPLATGLAALRPCFPPCNDAIGGAGVGVAVSGVAKLGTGFAVTRVGGNDYTPSGLLAAAAGGTALSELGPFADFAIVALFGGSRSGSRGLRGSNIGQFNGRHVESFK